MKWIPLWFLMLLLAALPAGSVPPSDPPRLEPVKDPEPPPPGPPKLRTRAEARAPEQSIVKPISVDVYVTNYANSTCDDIEVGLQLIPEKLSAGQHPYPPGGDVNSYRQPGLLDTVDLDMRLDALYPGRTRKLSFTTPYYSTSGFRTDHGYFMVENLVPNLRRSVLVKYKVSLKVAGKPLSQNSFSVPRNFFAGHLSDPLEAGPLLGPPSGGVWGVTQAGGKRR